MLRDFSKKEGWIPRKSEGIEWANEIISDGEELIDSLIELLSRTKRVDIIKQLNDIKEMIEEIAFEYLIDLISWLHEVLPNEICINEEKPECKILLEYNSVYRRFETTYYIRGDLDA